MWSSRPRPLEVVYPLVFFDALRVKIRDEGFVRDKAMHVALGVTKEILGLWLEQNEGAKFWLRVMNDIRNPGVEDVLIAVVDALNGFPEAILAVFPQATLQTCIVHLLRHSLDFTSYKDRKPVAALKDIYRALEAKAAEAALSAFETGSWGRKYPAIGQSWRRAWGEVAPFYAFHADVQAVPVHHERHRGIERQAPPRRPRQRALSQRRCRHQAPLSRLGPPGERMEDGAS